MTFNYNLTYINIIDKKNNNKTKSAVSTNFFHL